MKFRILTLALAILLILSSVGCSGGSTPTGGETGKSYIPKASKDELKLPDYEVKDKEVTFIVGGDFTEEGSTSVWATVRKMAQEKYGIDFKPILTTSAEQASLTTSMLAAGTPPSFVETHRTTGWFPRLSAEGVFVDVNTLINREDMLWRDMLDYIDYYSLGDASYACVTNVYAPETMTYDVKLIKKAGLEDPMSVYKKGKWTWDKMLEYIDKISGDTNGDGVIDVYGMDLSYLGQAYMCSLGKGMTTMENGKVSLSPLTDGNYEKFGNFVSNLRSRSGKGYIKPVENAVSSATTLFSFAGYWGVNNNNTLNTKMKNGELALIPIPKHSEADKYYMYGITAGYAISAADNPVGAIAVLSCYRYLNYPNETNLKSFYDKYISEGWNKDSAHILTYDINCNPGAYQDISLVPVGNDFASADISSVITKLRTDVIEKGENWATVRDKYMTRLENAVNSANKY